MTEIGDALYDDAVRDVAEVRSRVELARDARYPIHDQEEVRLSATADCAATAARLALVAQVRRIADLLEVALTPPGPVLPNAAAHVGLSPELRDRITAAREATPVTTPGETG